MRIPKDVELGIRCNFNGATSALAVIDSALDTVNSGRGSLGAIQNRFESVVASQLVASENLSASKSRIEDADFAAETAALTRLRFSSSQVLLCWHRLMRSHRTSSSASVMSLSRTEVLS